MAGLDYSTASNFEVSPGRVVTLTAVPSTLVMGTGRDLADPLPTEPDYTLMTIVGANSAIAGAI